MTASVTVKATNKPVIVSVSDYNSYEKEDGSYSASSNTHERHVVAKDSEMTFSIYGNRNVSAYEDNEEETE